MKAKIIVSNLFLGLLIIGCASQSQLTAAPVPLTASSTTTPIPSPTATPNYDLLTNSGKVLLDFALSPNGTMLGVYTNQEVYVYNLETQKKLFIEKFKNNDYIRFHTGAGAIAFSSNEKILAVSGKFPGEPISIWSLNTNNLLGEISFIWKDYSVTEIAFNSTGERLIVRSTRNGLPCEGPEDSLTIYDISEFTTNPSLRKSHDIYNLTTCSIVSPYFQLTTDGKLFVRTGGTAPQYAISLIDTDSGNVISRNQYDAQQDFDIYSISPNGELIAIGELQGRTTIRRFATNEILEEIDGRIIRLWDTEKFLIWNPSSNLLSFWKYGKLLCTLNDSTIIKTSLDGSILGLYDRNRNELQIWDIPNCVNIDKIIFDQ